MRQPFNHFNCWPSVDPFSQFYLFRTTMIESPTNTSERSSRKICTISCAATTFSSPPYTTSQRYRFKIRLRLASTPRYPSYFPTKFSILFAIGQPSEAAVGPSLSFVEVLARVLRSCTHIHRQPRPWIHCSFLRAAKCATSFKYVF